MENVTEALHMAAAVLVFVLALSISINAFGQARLTSQVLLEYQDREYDYTYVDEADSTKRVVGMETIIPSIYKAYKENYKIVFKFKDENSNYLYIRKNGEKVYTIDLENDVLGNDTQKEDFIRALLSGNSGGNASEIEKSLGITLNSAKFYDIIKGKNFEEELGIYYQEDIQGKYDAPIANRTKKRVITYTEM